MKIQKQFKNSSPISLFTKTFSKIIYKTFSSRGIQREKYDIKIGNKYNNFEVSLLGLKLS
jgi:hypothetical protein